MVANFLNSWSLALKNQTPADDILAGGDRVVVRWSSRGTHRNEYYGIPPTGREIRHTGIDIVRISGGKIVERWGGSDDLGLLQQLGAL